MCIRDRIQDINRLLKQFTSLETTLSKLQTQQTSLNNIQTISFNNNNR